MAQCRCNTLAAVCLLLLWPGDATATTVSAAQTMATETTTVPQALTPGDFIDPDRLNAPLLADLITTYTNQERTSAGLTLVQPDDRLRALAEKHSRDMAQRGYFSHEAERTTGSISYEDRLPLEELGYRRIAENLALEPVIQSRKITTVTASDGQTTRSVREDRATYEEMARSAVEGWMKSPGHRRNILTPEFNLVGMGFGVGRRDGTPYVYITQEFAQR